MVFLMGFNQQTIGMLMVIYPPMSSNMTGKSTIVSRTKKGLGFEGFTYDRFAFLKYIFLIELYKGCWQLKTS